MRACSIRVSLLAPGEFGSIQLDAVDHQNPTHALCGFLPKLAWLSKKCPHARAPAGPRPRPYGAPSGRDGLLDWAVMPSFLIALVFPPCLDQDVAGGKMLRYDDLPSHSMSRALLGCRAISALACGQQARYTKLNSRLSGRM